MADEDREKNESWPASLYDSIAAVFRQMMAELNFCIVGVVEKYDFATRKAEVTPQIKMLLSDGRYEAFPKIAGVPVSFPFGSRGGLKFDLRAGSTGTILFSQRSIEKWLSTGGLAESGDPRKFHLTDAIFFPGVSPFNVKDGNEVKDSLILGYDESKIRMNGNKIAIGNREEELLNLIDEAFDKISTAVTATGIGAQPLSVAADFTALRVRLAKIKGSLS